MERLRHLAYKALRWSERYTRTDMVYLARSGFWVNLNFWIVSFLSFLLSIAFANWLTKDEYGIYQYLLSLFGLLGALSFSGMSSALTQAIARGYEGTLRASIRPQLLWNFGAGVLGLLMSAYYFYKGNTELGTGLLIIGLTLPLYHTFNTYSAFYIGRKDFKTSFFYTLSVNLPYYACIFLGVYLLRDALALLFINLFVNTALISFNYWRTIRKPHSPSTDSATFPYARHLTYMNVLGVAVGQVDSLFVFQFLGPADLATYTLVKLIPERLGGLFKSVTMPAFPKFATRNPKEIRGAILHKTALLIIGLLICITGYIVIAPWFFRLVYPQYLEAIPYTQVYALALIGVAANLASNALTAHRKQAELYLLNTAVPISQLVVQIAGVTIWGLWGLIGGKIISAFITLGASLLTVLFSKEADGMNQNTTVA